MHKRILSKKLIIKLLLLLLAPLAYLISYEASLRPDLVERSYSGGFYKLISQPLSRLSGLVPFSLGEILLYLIIILFSVRIIWLIIKKLVLLALKIFNRGESQTPSIMRFIFNILVTASILYFCFIIIWGLNYYRYSFAQIANYEVKPSSADELENLCLSLTAKANSLRPEVEADPRKAMVIKEGYSKVFELAPQGYHEAAKIFPELGGSYGYPKPIFLSKRMSYTGISGIYFPFTGEANINVDIPDSLLPVTVCHEMAHQRGFAREDEANYIAWVVCSHHSSSQFQYSGTILALIYAMNALVEHAPDKVVSAVSHYSPGLIADLQYIYNFWEEHESKANDIATDINDAYLKSNQQEEGVESYGEMVDLLLAEQRSTS